MYQPGVDPKKAAALGYTPQELERTEAVPVWSINWRAVNIFIRVATQWVYSWRGREALHYPSVYPLVDRAATSPADWDALLDDIRIMERAALQEIRSHEHEGPT